MDKNPNFPTNATVRQHSLWSVSCFFRNLRSAGYSYQQVYNYILQRIYSGALPPAVGKVFLDVCNDYGAIACALRQGVSAPLRRVAMIWFKKKVRYGDFSLMFTAAGHIPGLVALMATMSVRELSLLCRYMGESTSQKTCYVSRCEEYFSKLLRALRNVDGDSPYIPKNPDTRALDSHYNKILPACTPEMVFKEIEKIEKPEKMANRADRKSYKDNFIAVIFPTNGIGKKITPYKFVLDGNGPLFSLQVLRGLSLIRSSLKLNADNLVKDLVLPLARRLNYRRERETFQEALYRLLIICTKQEPIIAKSIDNTMITHAIKAWGRARESKRHMTSYLCDLVRVMTSTYPWTLDRISTELRHVKRSLRPELFELLLRNARPFKLDIRLPFNTDPQVIRCLGKSWPPKLFYLLPSGISLQFFKYLSAIHPDNKFIARDCGVASGIKYINCDDKQSGDADVLLALLHSRQPHNDPYGMAWLMGTHKALRQRASRAKHAQTTEEMAS
ncbi:hypothetical protein F5B19DRAFT_355121 [Rostrohypoxylon terebratum]|nr:hypothetical protein F5B19DRAFT_355121 [Rostrohypoxylon terebratum]